MAEIALSHLLRLATEQGCPVSRKQALAFLNQEGRAFEMWKQMMQADEDFIKCSLLRQCISPKRTQPIGFSVSNTTDGRSRRQFVEIKARCPKLSSGGFFQLLDPLPRIAVARPRLSSPLCSAHIRTKPVLRHAERLASGPFPPIGSS